jgi:hypothetical protein
MNERLGFVFVALMAVPVALLRQEKPLMSPAPPAQSTPPANPITAFERPPPTPSRHPRAAVLSKFYDWTIARRVSNYAGWRLR